MPDFPDTGTDPAAEEQAAQRRALTMGLITGGLGILSQPRFRGEPASIPIARGALEGVDAYGNAMEQAGKDASERQKFKLEQSKLDAETAYRNQEIQDRQRGLDIQERGQQSLDTLRKSTEANNAPVGDGGVHMFAPYRNDPATAAVANSMSDEEIKAMPYGRYQNLRDSLETTRREGNKENHTPLAVTTMEGDKPVIHIFDFDHKAGSANEIYNGTAVNRAPRLSDLQVRLDAVKSVHPEWTPQMQMDFIDQHKADLAVDTKEKELRAADDISQQKEVRQQKAKEEMVAYAGSIKSKEDLNKALTKPINIGGTGFAPTVAVNPASGKPAIKYTPMGMSCFTKPVFVDLPPDVAGGSMPAAIAPPGRKLNLKPETLAALLGKTADGDTFEHKGKVYQRVGDGFIDVTNPPPGTTPPAGTKLPPPEGASPSATPAATPSAGPTVAAAAPSAAPTPIRPSLFKDPKSGKPLYNSKTGEYVFADDKGRLYRAKSEDGPFVPISAKAP